MKSWHRLGLRSLTIAPALVALGAATHCSSSSDSGGPPPTVKDSGGGDATPGTGPTEPGTGMACTPNAHETVGTKITLNVTWPQTLANNGGKGVINIWLLAHYDINGTAVTGTTETCRNDTPPIPLTSTGTLSEGLDGSVPAVVLTAFDPSVWKTINANPAKAPTPTSGTLGGWNVGASMQIDPTNSVYGLAATSTFAKDTTQWPGSEMALTTADLADDDMDGHPGITITPSQAMGYSLPATAALQTPPVFADKLYVTLRTELELYGTSSTCNDVSGTVNVKLLNNHIVGCELLGGADCSQAQWDFIDTNTTVYVGPGVKIPSSVPAASFAPPRIYGAFVAKIMSTDADGGSISCDDVIKAFP